MDWSFKLLLVFAAVFAILAADHYLLGEALTSALAGTAAALAGGG